MPEYRITVTEYGTGCECPIFTHTNFKGPKRAVIKSDENSIVIDLYPVKDLPEDGEDGFE